MATTENFFNGTGSATEFQYTFPALLDADIKASVDAGSGFVVTTAFTLLTSPTRVKFDSAPASGTNNVRIFRDTNVDSAKAVFAAGSSIRAADLNNNMDQVLYSNQEKDRPIAAEDISDGVITSAKIATGTIVDADVNASAAIAQSKIALDAELTELGTMSSGTASALADLSQTEVQILDGATLSTAELNYVDGVTSAIQTQVDAKQAADADLTALSSCQTGAAAKVALLTADEVEKLDGLTASTTELNKIDGVTATTAELNLVAGMTKQTTISDQDTSYPTSGAVVDYVAAAIAPIGGLEVIADDESFPNTLPAAGVVISITDAAGLSINSSGVSTNGDTLDNTTVTINGFPSALRGGVGGNADPYVLGAGSGLMVQSTGSSQTYNYHKALIKESDYVQLSDDINDFNSRYRVAGSAPGSNNDEGDLYFDTGSNKMFVYDGSAWGEVTSTGDFKYLVLTEAGTTNAAVYDNSKVSFDLKENTTGGSAAAVTNAAQLMVSINGVVQKPNTGTNTSGLDGFVMTDADTIKFTAGVPTGASVFAIQSGSALSINTPGDNTVTSAKIVNDTIVNADINSAAAIVGSKLADDSITEAKLDIHAAPSGTDKYLGYTSNGMEWATVAQYTTPLTTRGDILFRDASGDQRLAKGTDGQFLKIGANDPVWADVVGAVADNCIYENDQTISNNYTIASGKGAHSVGPITVNATVTVNGNWVVS